MMRNEVNFLIKKLVLVGIDKNYTVTFDEGLNIIYGDSDTGKSTILELIDYCFGASSLDLYPEIEVKGKYCLLEIIVNELTLTIKRDIFYPKNYIEVFGAAINSVLNNEEIFFPKLLSPNYSEEGPSGFFSDFMLELFNIPKVEIKMKPSKQDSSSRKLSFRDIMHYCYLNQDDIGSKNILHSQSSRYAINKQVFKFINKILDKQITELEKVIAEKRGLKLELIKKEEIIISFLQETQIGKYTELEEIINKYSNQLLKVSEELKKIDKEIINSTENLNDIRITYKEFEKRIEDISVGIKQENMNIIDYSKLKSSYATEIKKMRAAIKISNPLQRKKIEDFSCPLCSSSIKLEKLTTESETEDKEILEKELKALNEKSKNLNILIFSKHEKISNLEIEREKLQEKHSELGLNLEKKSKDFINPYIEYRDILSKKRVELEQKINQCSKEIKIRNQIVRINNEINQLETNIQNLNKDLEILKENAPNDDEVREKLGNYLHQIIEDIGLQYVYNVSIDKNNLLPKFRGKGYSTITSGGVRTALSFAYFLALLKTSIDDNLYKPKLLMFDTIGKYIGKILNDKYLDEINIEKDNEESLRNDPQKYINMYKELLKVCNYANDKGKMVQIIVVDNDNPGAEYNRFVRKKFSITPKSDFEIGLIDDWKYE